MKGCRKRLSTPKARAIKLAPKVAGIALEAVTAAVNSLEIEIRVLTGAGDERQIRWKAIELALAETLKPLGWRLSYDDRCTIFGWQGWSCTLNLRVQGDVLRLTILWGSFPNPAVLLSSTEIPLPPGIAQVLDKAK